MNLIQLTDIKTPYYTREELDALFKYKNGDTVECRITGFKGVIINRALNDTSGCTYTVVSFELLRKKPVEASFDEVALKPIESDRSISSIATEPCSVGMRSNVHLIESPEIDGKVTSIVEHCTGCVYIRIRIKGLDRDLNPRGSVYMGISAFGIDEDVLAETIANKEKTMKKAHNKEPGGPSESASTLENNNTF